MWCVANVFQGMLMLMDPYLWPEEAKQEAPDDGPWIGPPALQSGEGFFYGAMGMPPPAPPAQPPKKQRHPIYRRDKVPADLDAIVIGR